MLISKFLNCNVESKVANLEKKYKITLPSQYKTFLHKYNGGYTPKTKFKTGKLSSDIQAFFGIGDVILSLDTIDLDEWLQKKLFPIACDSFGNHIVISLHNESMGNIYFCDHENGNMTTYITENLNDFFAYCKSEKISEASRRTIKEREEILIAKGKGNIITDDLRRMWQTEIDKYRNMVQEEVSLD